MARYLKHRDKLLQDMMISERQAIVARMYMVDDMTQVEIAQELGVSQATISQDIKKIHEEFKMRQTLPVQWHKEKQLMKLNKVEKEAWAGWERSIGTSKRTVTKKDGSGATIEEVETVDELVGDPRFLQRIQGVIETRIRILGLDEPHELIINTMEDKLSRLINDGRVTFDMLVNDVGRQQAVKYFNIAGVSVPDIVEGELVEVE